MTGSTNADQQRWRIVCHHGSVVSAPGLDDG